MKAKKLKKNKSGRWLEEYRSVISGKTELLSVDRLETMAQELLDYCHEDPTATVTKFATQIKGIPWSVFCKLKDKHAVLGQAYDDAMIMIGDNREAGALTNQLNDKVVLKSLPMYLARWKELEEWSAKLKKENSSTVGNGVFKIEIPSYGPQDRNEDQT